MGTSEKEIKENYEKNLKAADYVTMMQYTAKDYSDVHRFPLKVFYEILLSGRFEGSKLLELGSGAVVYNIALASAFYKNIIMSDFVEDNCKELKRWLKAQSTLKQCLDIPAEIEGYSEDLEAGKKLIEERIRKTVRQVVRCDVLDDNIFLEDVNPNVAPPYDFITSTLCLESAAPDFHSFVLALKRINKILRVGGGLFLVGFLNGEPWHSALPLNESKFHYLQIDEKDVKKALEESGFGNIDMRVRDKFDFEYVHDGFYCVIAEKVGK